jgi:hypothetical protein
VADGGTGRYGPLGDRGDEGGTADFDDPSAQHFGGVDDVAADIGEHPTAGPAAVAPGHRDKRVECVAVPGVAVDMHRAARWPSSISRRIALIPGDHR